jgi:hypothetical protein
MESLGDSTLPIPNRNSNMELPFLLAHLNQFLMKNLNLKKKVGSDVGNTSNSSSKLEFERTCIGRGIRHLLFSCGPFWSRERV